MYFWFYICFLLGFLFVLYLVLFFNFLFVCVAMCQGDEFSVHSRCS